MKRDYRLHGLSSEHHHALVLARSLTRLVDSGHANAETAKRLARQFQEQLEPHFRIEEELLLPALRAVGEHTLAQRLEADHAFLRACARSAESGISAELEQFAVRLHDHVRFEERELFPVCETRLAETVLEEVARRAPKEV